MATASLVMAPPAQPPPSCANTAVQSGVVKFCTCSSKPSRAHPVYWYTEIVSISMTSGHESVTLLPR
eukprot:scaffold36306_cov62-Phaeocystis_antarctica.AAC.8